MLPLRRLSSKSTLSSSRSALDASSRESLVSLVPQGSAGEGDDRNNGKPEDDIFYEGPADPYVLTKWDSGSPSSAWYATRLNKRRRFPNSRRCSLGLAPVDVLILLLSIGALILVQEGDRGRTCSVRLADLAVLRIDLFRCKEEVRATKKMLRGKISQSLDLCKASPSELLSFLNFTKWQPCRALNTSVAADPVETLISQRRCRDIPRRVCTAPLPTNSVEPLPLPQALWAPLDDRNVAWGEYGASACTSFECLENLGSSGGNALQGTSFALARVDEVSLRGKAGAGRAPPTISSVLALKDPGVIRTGLDVWGGVGNFAAEMAEKGVTVVTTGLNQGAPVLQAVAMRGLPGLYLPFTAQLPFFNGALDLVRCASWPREVLEESSSFEAVLFEWDRVLRPGGILWLDLLPENLELLELIEEVVSVLQLKKCWWKLKMTSVADPSSAKQHRYAVLEKPLQRVYS